VFIIKNHDIMNTANEAKALAACTYDIMNHGVKQTDKKKFLKE
jgi:hypothetical protein